MSNKTAQQLVQDRLSDLGAIAPVSSHPISFRLSPEYVEQADVLAKFLGYGNRSQLLREVVETALDDLVVETHKALSDDPHSQQYFSDALKSRLDKLLDVR